MLSLYRSLLRLYPSSYRDEFGEEMMAVLFEVQAQIGTKGWMTRAVSYARTRPEGYCAALSGSTSDPLLIPTVAECFHRGGSAMRSEFRFPKATVTLMAIILAGILMAIDKARAIQAARTILESTCRSNSIVAADGFACALTHIGRRMRGRSGRLGHPFCVAPLWSAAAFGR